MYFEVTTVYEPIASKEFPLAICPKCGKKNVLVMHFFQKKVNSNLYEQTTHKVSASLICRNTNSEIDPVLWTDDLVRYFETEKTKLKLAPKSFKLKPLTYIMVFAIVLGIIGFAAYRTYLFKEYDKTNELLQHPVSGQQIKASLFRVTGTSKQNLTDRFTVIYVDNDSVKIQAEEGEKMQLTFPLNEFKKRTLYLPIKDGGYYSGYIDEIKE